MERRLPFKHTHARTHTYTRRAFGKDLYSPICSNITIFMLNTKQLIAENIPLPRLQNRCHVLVSFWMAPQHHSSGVIQHNTRTATCAVSLPLLQFRAQLSTALRAGAFCRKLQTTDNE